MTDEDSDRDSDPADADPFERLGPGPERDGDPFDHLDDATGDAEDRDDVPPDDVWRPPDARQRAPSEAARRDTSEESDAETADGNVDANGSPSGPLDGDDPFAHVEPSSESPFDGADNVFDRVDAGVVDPDRVWASITADDDAAGDGADDRSTPDEGRYSEVSKHAFCEGCEHFSSPPDVACNHHTAEIIEFLDVETVRLLDCPVVAERESLERRE